ncbi:reverse transcriptase domain-containing protein [Tanacetum coccineum]
MPSKRTTTTTTPMTDAAIKALIAQGVATVLAEYEANKGSGNGDGSLNSGSGRRTERAARKCTYNDFLKCQPLNFKGIEGVVGLTQWFEKMESDFHKSNCTVGNQVKFATCTLLGNALTWWNSHIKTVGHNAAYGMPWKTLRKMMTDKYCPRAENKRKLDDNSRKNQNQQQPFKKQNITRAYTAGPSDKREYGGSLPLFTKCNYHHHGLCAPKCNKVGHLARDCRNPTNANADANNQRDARANQRVVTCFECGVQGHYKRDYLKLKNNNPGNQVGNGNAQDKAYALGEA